MERRILAALIFICFGKVFGQNIEGRIINSENSEAIVDARIKNLTSDAVVFSGENGEFSLEAEDLPIKLEITYLGFQNNYRTVTSYNETLLITLDPVRDNLSEVVVRSTIIPNELQEVPASVGLLTENDLRRTDATALMDNFNYVPGMYVNQGALNTNKINIRGIGARSQYSTNRIQAYFDGIPMTTAEGELTLDDIDQESLERVEIIKGPTSSIYGAGLGGSINLYSANPEAQGTTGKVNYQLSSFNTSKKTVLASHSSENTSFFANYSHLKSDGYRENGEYDRKSALVNAKLLTSENNSLSFLANFTQLKAFIPSSLNEEDFINDPETAAYTWGASEGYESYDRGLLGLAYTHQFSENFDNTTSIYMNFRNGYEPRPFDILKEERLSAGARTKFNLNTNIGDLASQLSFGAEYYNEWYEIGTFENLFEDFTDQGSVRGARLSNNEQVRNYANFFGQISLEITENWNAEAGFNINTTGYTLTDLYAEDEVDQTGDYRFNTIFSPRIGTTYEVAPGKNIYASISHGFSTPTVAETLTPEGQINTDLEPETGINYEIGFKGNWLNNRLYTEVALYSIQIENLLVAQRIGQDQYVGVNAGKTDHNGIEFLAQYNFDFGAGITGKPYVNAAFNFFEFDEFINEDVDNAGNELPGVPKSTVNLGLDLSTAWGLTFYSNYRAVGEIPLNDSNSEYTDSYELVNLKAVYSLNVSDYFEINFNAGINNVLDEHYAASVVTNAVGFGGAAPRYYYPGNPRNYFGGVGVRYNF
ncbi:TonB-dependent receptor [Autumnicola psychrophila]|uniref:TonB-dependent receptor n=1 Tax=Autumnicola psychrophila TaxID=3075592 RepID=A0ABU3DQV3_9FLAO|nr:TonB-dependent receptor [Zunongwangia sp. F225]MDT0686092.1 TonB-dependent receptor [Zunongwangia sp. F225]